MRDDLKISYYLVSFIDVLGQKKAFDGITKLPSCQLEEQAFHSALQNTVGFLDHFRDGFRDYFTGAKGPSHFFESLPSSQKEELRELFQDSITYQNFSDSVIIYLSLQTERYFCSQLNGIHKTLYSSCAMFLLSLSTKHALRGGIEMGLAFELNKGEIYGPALNKAYHLENEVAQYPRIVIGPELIDFLNSFKTPMDNSIQANYSKLTAEACLKLITQDDDGCYILDYLSDDPINAIRSIENTLPDKHKLHNIFNRSLDFINSSIMTFENENNKKLLDRYKHLLSYFRKKGVN